MTHDDRQVDVHAPTIEEEAHGGEVAEEHGEQELGPIDWAAWGAGALGAVIGLVMTLCFMLATSTI